MIIRQETAKDHDNVYEVVKTAFAAAEHSDGNEQDLVNKLRKSKSFVPELSLVAVDEGKIVGYILFTKIRIGTHIALALAPLAVLPEYRHRGIGLALIQKGHDIAKNLGYDFSVVLGHSEYYPKAGYEPASRFGIKAPFDVPDENFMAAKLNKNAGEINGTVKYDNAFGIA